MIMAAAKPFRTFFLLMIPYRAGPDMGHAVIGKKNKTILEQAGDNNYQAYEHEGIEFSEPVNKGIQVVPACGAKVIKAEMKLTGMSGRADAVKKYLKERDDKGV